MIDIYTFVHPTDEVGGIMSWGCASVCACVRVYVRPRAEAFSDRLAVDLYTVRQKKGTTFLL